MKKLFDEDLLRKLFEKWKVVLSPQNDGSKYGNISMDAMVYNDILGHCRVRQIRELEDDGAIVFQKGKWKIKAQTIFVTSENKERFNASRHLGQAINIPSDAWYAYIESTKYQNPEEELLFGKLF